MTEFITPYNFVPLSEHVLYPDWGYAVSQDIPFQNSLTGKIKFTIKNHTALCIGGSQSKNSDSNKNEPSVVNFIKTPDGVPFIPGSTIKGALRNTMAIACFGKFTQTNNKKLSERRFENSETTYFKTIRNKYKLFEKYTILKNEKQTKQTEVSIFSHPGWLKYDNTKNCWIFKQCSGGIDGVLKLTNNSINELLSTNISNNAEKTAVTDYEDLKKANTTLNTVIKANLQKGNYRNKDRAIANKNGQIEGYIVCCNYRLENSNSSVDYSYLFREPENNIYEVSNEVFADFYNAHIVEKDLQQNKNEKPLIEYLLNEKNQNKDYGIPVFVFINKDTDQVEKIGLCRMPRLLADKGIHELITDVQDELIKESPIYDLPDLIFGTISDNNLTPNYSLKGRVSISDALLEGKKQLKISEHLFLSSPKISFAPTYLAKGNSYLEENIKIAGWKKYYIRKEFVDRNYKPFDPKHLNLASKLQYLDSGNEFNGEIIFNNLKEEELSALIWLLRLGDTGEAKHFYNIGYGKPYGAGKISFNISEIEFAPYIKAEKKAISEYIDNFSEFMDKAIKNKFEKYKKWSETPQYIKLLDFSKDKDFIKRNGEYLIYNTMEGINEKGKKESEFNMLRKENKNLSTASYSPIKYKRDETFNDPIGEKQLETVEQLISKDESQTPKIKSIFNKLMSATNVKERSDKHQKEKEKQEQEKLNIINQKKKELEEQQAKASNDIRIKELISEGDYLSLRYARAISIVNNLNCDSFAFDDTIKKYNNLNQILKDFGHQIKNKELDESILNTPLFIEFKDFLKTNANDQCNEFLNKKNREKYKSLCSALKE